MINNEIKIINWLKICPDFEVTKIEGNPTIDKSLIWGKLSDKSFNGVSFAALKYFLVDTYEWHNSKKDG